MTHNSEKQNLTAKLLSSNVEPEDIFAFIQEQKQSLADPRSPYHKAHVVITDSEFFQAKDLVHYLSVISTWPAINPKNPQAGDRDSDGRLVVPARFAAPTLLQLCYNYWDGPTFAQRFELQVSMLNSYLAELEKEFPLKKKDIKAQKAQEAAKVRSSAQMAYAHYMTVCAERRAAMAEWSEKVEEARQAWEFAKKDGV